MIQKRRKIFDIAGITSGNFFSLRKIYYKGLCENIVKKKELEEKKDEVLCLRTMRQYY